MLFAWMDTRALMGVLPVKVMVGHHRVGRRKKVEHHGFVGGGAAEEEEERGLAKNTASPRRTEIHTVHAHGKGRK